MRLNGHIAIDLIDVDRFPIGPRTVSLIDFLRQGNHVPPIHIQPTVNGRFRILDGRHRLLAYRMLGRQSIRARWGTR